jgi:hypothetical protein
MSALRRTAVNLTTLLASTALVWPAMAVDQKVGIHGAVNPAGTATFPSGPVKQLVLGQEVVFKERIETEPGGQTQVLFLDESALSVGPSSSIVIDEFVYNPHTKGGRLAMSTTQGVFRYIGGAVSKLESGVNIRLPSVSLGIRGGAFLLDVRNSNRVEIIFLYGKELIIGLGGQTQTITLSRPGFGACVGDAAQGAARAHRGDPRPARRPH